jgi:glycosyltransferase involved in cell wall biosynthesis
MRIGVVPFLFDMTGLCQYCETMIRVLYEWKRDGCDDEFVIFSHDVKHRSLLSLGKRRGWLVRPLWPEAPRSKQQRLLDWIKDIVREGSQRVPLRWLPRRLRAGGMAPTGQAVWEGGVPVNTDPGAGQIPLNPDEVRFNADLDAWFRSFEVELLIYPGMCFNPFEVSIPYVMTIHDLQHRLQPEFPEVSVDGEWESREHYYRNGTRYATLLVAESEVGKEDILKYYGPYGVTADQVRMLPYLPASYLDVNVTEKEKQRVRKKYALPDQYLFCPAQFYPHKNHARVIRALAALKEQQGLRIPLVCCGLYPDKLRKRTFDEAMELAQQLGVREQVSLLPYVPDGDMSALYAGAVALVFMTFFGPTNIPPLEAWSFGCPVLTSDIRGIREQMGDAALLADPRSVEAIAAGIHRLWTNSRLRSNLIAQGRARLASYTPKDYRLRLEEILGEAKERVKAGHVPMTPSFEAAAVLSPDANELPCDR